MDATIYLFIWKERQSWHQVPSGTVQYSALRCDWQTGEKVEIDGVQQVVF